MISIDDMKGMMDIVVDAIRKLEENDKKLSDLLVKQSKMQVALAKSVCLLAEEIDKIIKFFRTELYPSTTGGGTELIGYNFPNLFDIEMSYNNQQVATKIKPVYLKEVGTTYNPGNMGYHVDGKASEVDITLAFVEERTLNKQDIVEGF